MSIVEYISVKMWGDSETPQRLKATCTHPEQEGHVLVSVAETACTRGCVSNHLVFCSFICGL
jgi:hypothetical protein